jgi:hypothetical protein
VLEVQIHPFFCALQHSGREWSYVDENIENQLIKCESDLFQELTNSYSIAKLTDLASRLLGNPVLAVERDGKILAFSGDMDEIRSEWTGIGESLYGDGKALMEAIACGDTDLMYTRDEPVLTNFSGYTYPWLAARIVVDNGVIGQIAVAGKNLPFDDYAKKAITLISKAVACAYRIGTAPYALGKSPFLTLLLDIMCCCSGKLSLQCSEELH